MDYNLYYKGYIVPKKIRPGGGVSCYNSYCHDIACTDCINLPTIEATNILHDYLMEINRDEHISTSTEGLPDGSDDGGC